MRRLSRDVLGRARAERISAAFVEALTGAGWLAALIPEEYGGAGLPLAGGARSSNRSTRAVGTPPPATRRCTRVGDGYVVRGQKWKQGHYDAARTLHGPASRAYELAASPLSCFPGLSTAAAAPTRPRCSPS